MAWLPITLQHMHNCMIAQALVVLQTRCSYKGALWCHAPHVVLVRLRVVLFRSMRQGLMLHGRLHAMQCCMMRESLPCMGVVWLLISQQVCVIVFVVIVDTRYSRIVFHSLRAATQIILASNKTALQIVLLRAVVCMSLHP